MDDYKFSTSLFIGETSRGIPQPVFFDLHTQIFNNKPPGVVITGEPGTGKTFLAMTLTAMSAILGKTTVVLDPKGDFVSLMNLQEDVGKFNLWNLMNPRLRGLLDPFRLADTPGEQLDLAFTLIELFTGGITGDERTALSPIIKDVAELENPSLGRVVQELRGSQNSHARNLGTTLDLLSRLPLAALCFGQPGAHLDKVSLGKGLTVITFAGMKMPTPNGTDNKSRLATGILYLVTDFIRRLMEEQESKSPKTIVIDEAWSILQTEAGASMVQSVALLGRSHNVAMLLVTQNNSHLDHLDIENTIKTRFAFRSSPKEAAAIVRDMQLPEGEDFEGRVTSLVNGECLMQDFIGRYSTVQISAWNKQWAEAFVTNPLEKAKKRSAEEAKASAS